MKAIIYAGIGLFSVATVYGITDYYNANKNGSIDKLYNENSITAAALAMTTDAAIATAINNETVLNTNEENENNSAAKYSSKNKRSIKLESFSRAIIVEEPDQFEEVKPEAVIKDPAGKVEPIVIESNQQGNKKVNLKMFSRAPLKSVVKNRK